MATIGTIIGSKYIGCPITVPVTCASLSAATTFRRVRLKVTINTTNEFEFSTPVSAGVNQTETVQFDISSALRAVAEQYEYQSDTENVNYPVYTVKLDAYDDYMIDGQSSEGMYHHTSTLGNHFCQGRLTDRERLTSATPQVYSRKPTSGTEVIFIGSTYISAGATSADPAITRTTVAAATSIAGTYVVAMPQDGYELLFVNSMGVHESLCLQCLRDEETPITTNSYVVAKQETISQFSRSLTRKQDDREEWKLSSGPLDQAWLRYYIHEVLMAEVAWLKVNGQWLPIEILPDDSVVGVSRTKADMLEVQFKVKFGINGSPW